MSGSKTRKSKGKREIDQDPGQENTLVIPKGLYDWETLGGSLWCHHFGAKALFALFLEPSTQTNSAISFCF